MNVLGYNSLKKYYLSIYLSIFFLMRGGEEELEKQCYISSENFPNIKSEKKKRKQFSLDR